METRPNLPESNFLQFKDLIARKLNGQEYNKVSDLFFGSGYVRESRRGYMGDGTFNEVSTVHDHKSTKYGDYPLEPRSI